MEFILLVLDVVLIGTTLLPFIRKGRWWIRVFDFPRLQLLALYVLALGLHVVWWDESLWIRAGAALLVACAVYQVARIYPYTPLAGVQALPATRHKGAETIRLLVANVLMSNREAGRLLALVQQTEPDLFLSVETDDWWAEQLDVLEATYPYTLKHPLGNTYGMLLYSRLPFKDAHIQFRIEDEVPSMQTRLQLKKGSWIRFYALHPRPPCFDQDSVNRDAELMLVGQEAAQRSEPVLVAGDLNDVAWSYTTGLFQKIGGLLDPRRGRGMYNTYNAKIPFMRYPLDHIFISEQFRVLRLERLPAFGSDHFPMLIELSYEPERQNEQEAPAVDRDDEEQAEEMIEEAPED